MYTIKAIHPLQQKGHHIKNLNILLLPNGWPTLQAVITYVVLAALMSSPSLIFGSNYINSYI